MEELKKALFAFLDTLSAAIIAAENGKIVYSNPAAARLYPNILGADAQELFGGELASPGAAAEVSWRGEILRGVDMGDLRLITVSPDRQPLAKDRSFVDSLVSEIHSSLGAGMYRLFDVTKRAREAGDLASIRDLAAMDRSLCRVLRLARNLGRVFGDEDSQPKKSLLDLGALARDIVSSVSYLTGERGVRLDFSAQQEVELYGDRRLLEIMLMELLSNAVKFSRPGGAVAVAVGISGGSAVIRVADTGSGDDPARTAPLRERFGLPAYALDPDAGAGLGLRVARHIAALHGGAIITQTLPGGAGTTVTAALPLTDPPGGAALSEPNETSCTAFDILIEISDIADDSAFESRDAI